MTTVESTVDYIGLWYQLEEQQGPVNAWDWLKGNGVYNLPMESLAPLRALARQSIEGANRKAHARRQHLTNWLIFWLVLALAVDLGVAGLLYPANSAMVVSLAGLMSTCGLMFVAAAIPTIMYPVSQIPRDLLTSGERKLHDTLNAAAFAYLGYELVKHLQK